MVWMKNAKLSSLYWDDWPCCETADAVIGLKYLEVIWQGSDDIRTLLLEYDYLSLA